MNPPLNSSPVSMLFSGLGCRFPSTVNGRSSSVCLATWLWLVAVGGAWAEDAGFPRESAGVFAEYCIDCHGNDNAEAHVNLEQLLVEPEYVTRFRSWEKIVAMLGEQQMPPEDMPQPSNQQRQRLVEVIRNQLDTIAHHQAGDPGRVALRRLTSAEYAYTIQDLTGLTLPLESVLIGDAAGGEGFTNVGDVQFVQDSTVERYLESAKLVASHAVIGSGPLAFFHDPGQTGLELSAIDRIQRIYRKYGFRTAAGEGGEPFGLDLYPRALFVTWRFRHRHVLEQSPRSLEQLAISEGVNPRFANHVWNLLNRHAPTFPLSEIVHAWQRLPHPTPAEPQQEVHVRRECDEIAAQLRNWQRRLARNTGDDEEAALLTRDSIRLSPSSTFRATIDWAEGADQASVVFEVASATAHDLQQGTRLIWRDPQIFVRSRDRRRPGPISLMAMLSEQGKISELQEHHALHLDGNDLVVSGAASLEISFNVPEGARGARLLVTAELTSDSGTSSIVRCTVRDGSLVGDTAADTGEISAILGRGEGLAFQDWRTGVLDFARLLPDVSHREPAPSDRDPIPAPFDNRYNTAERNDFHYTIKYHRDDDFFVQHMLDDAQRLQLDQAWYDLLLSFDYHDRYLSFVAKKVDLDLDGQTISNLRPEWTAKLPNGARQIVWRLVHNYIEAAACRHASHSRHMQDLLDFAESAWRRPLTADEQSRLRAFYTEMRNVAQLDHVDSVRATLTRILVAPAFLYRIESPPRQADPIALSQWELASRLSYFLWSSPPDRELRLAAERGELTDQLVLARHVRRMLADPKARRFVTEFFGQWFGFYRFDQYQGIDPDRFPEFSDGLRRSMYEEAVALFEFIVREDRPFEEILFADYAHWNQALAEHYGASSAAQDLGHQMQLVRNVNAHRGGLLSLGAVHAITSAPLRTSAVRRGDWILRRVLGTPVPPPPADAGSIPADDVLSDGKTVRDRLMAHRRDASCVNCHTRMDPLGFALENFDPVGRWREHYRDGQPVDASGVLNDGTEIAGLSGLERYLREHLAEFHRTLCSKLLGYALGRSEVLTDRLLIEQMMSDLEDGVGISELAIRIATSDQFRTKRGDP